MTSNQSRVIYPTEPGAGPPQPINVNQQQEQDQLETCTPSSVTISSSPWVGVTHPVDESVRYHTISTTHIGRAVVTYHTYPLQAPVHRVTPSATVAATSAPASSDTSRTMN